ncbi:MAG: PDZ domain-containing protein [Planctomycetota bacterium]|nr:PDZ domain-containing protein [Planctomycetota bacterium]
MRKAPANTFRTFKAASVTRFIYLSVSAAVVWLTILPTIAEEPITLDSDSALELLEAQILKNQQNTSKPNPPKPNPPKPQSSTQNPIPQSNPAAKDGTPGGSVAGPQVLNSASSEESLPPPIQTESIKPDSIRNESVQMAPLVPDATPAIGPLQGIAGESVSPRKVNALPNQVASPSGQPFLGLTLQKPSGNLLGLRVVAIADRSPAWKSGFLVSDRVLAVSDQAVSSIEEFAEVISSYSPGDQIRFLVDRSGRKKEITSILMDRQLADLSLPIDDPQAPKNYEPLGRLSASPNNSRSFGFALAPLSNAFRNHFGIPAYRGASVLEVRQNSPASQAGLSPGDCIVAMNNEDVQSDQDVLRWQLESDPGTVLPISFYRGSSFIQAEIVVPGVRGMPDAVRYNYPSSDLPLGATIRPQLNDNVQEEILELRREVQRLRDELRASEQRR